MLKSSLLRFKSFKHGILCKQCGEQNESQIYPTSLLLDTINQGSDLLSSVLDFNMQNLRRGLTFSLYSKRTNSKKIYPPISFFLTKKKKKNCQPIVLVWCSTKTTAVRYGTNDSKEHFTWTARNLFNTCTKGGRNLADYFLLPLLPLYFILFYGGFFNGCTYYPESFLHSKLCWLRCQWE